MIDEVDKQRNQLNGQQSGKTFNFHNLMFAIYFLHRQNNCLLRPFMKISFCSKEKIKSWAV